MTCFAKDDKNSHFLTDDRLRVFLPGTSPADADQELTPVPNVFAIGDCAQIKGKPLPATAQVASQMGKHLAFVLNGQMSDDDASGETIFKHKDMGSMASLGGGSAIVDGPKAKAQGRVSGRAAGREIASLLCLHLTTSMHRLHGSSGGQPTRL